MTRSIWSASALADLGDIDRYYQDRSPDFARRVGASAIDAARLLADNPYLGPAFAGEIRKWSIRGTEYFILYRPMPDGVDIVRVMHARRDTPHES